MLRSIIIMIIICTVLSGCGSDSPVIVTVTDIIEEEIIVETDLDNITFDNSTFE